ncbi:MAG TPA: hypothetical protein VFT27_07795 [Actinomycetota bacterium]|nr:hypothetical protein [Actinomycetota bacterium]
MSSAARSPSPRILSGPVSVCVDRPVLSLDRPFTYELAADLDAGVGSLVQVPFHGRLVRGWILGPTGDLPSRVLAVKKAVSPVRFFDDRMLELARWVSERYVAPLAAVLGAMVPPRVAGEEGVVPAGRASEGIAHGVVRAPLSDGYGNAAPLLDALRGGSGSFVLRPAPDDEADVAVETVGATLDGGRSAIVLVPEVDPLPATAAVVRDAFGETVAMYLGGGKRARYRMWLDIAAGRYRVVVGTRPAVFAPVPRLGLAYVARESHALHREERSPYYHVRDVALARARIEGAVAVMSSLYPSVEAAAAKHVAVSPRVRRWPPVEVVATGPEGRAPRLVTALRRAGRGFLYAPLPGYGVARVCRACGQPAACAVCGGTLRAEEGTVRCAVCGAQGRCAVCGATAFGVAPGGAERVEEWARRAAGVPVTRIGSDDPPRPPGPAEVLVGGVEAVKDLGPLGLDLVGILDADLAARRPGLSARERTLATWFEAAAWAVPHGRVIVQTRVSNDPAVQALVAGRPERFHRFEASRRAEAGFPVGAAVFRVSGTGELEAELSALEPLLLVATGLGDQTVCLLALEPESVAPFGRAARALAERGVVTRVEAEPHL